MPQDFRRLEVWQKAHRLALLAYEETATWPRGEDYALRSQVRKAAISVPANIAEGCGRQGDRELARFLQVALGSATELEYYVVLGRDLRLFEPSRGAEVMARVVEVKRMLGKLIAFLREGDQGIARRRAAEPAAPGGTTDRGLNDSPTAGRGSPPRHAGWSRPTENPRERPTD